MFAVSDVPKMHLALRDYPLAYGNLIGTCAPSLRPPIPAIGSKLELVRGLGVYLHVCARPHLKGCKFSPRARSTQGRQAHEIRSRTRSCNSIRVRAE